MNSKIIYSYFIIIIFFIILGNNIIFICNNNSTIITYSSIEFTNSTFHYNPNSNYSWPVFGYYNISSFFGKRNSPTSGASTYHSGIDIPAPTGTNIYSIDSRNSYIYWFLRC